MAMRSYLVQIGWDRNLVIQIVIKLYCESSNKGWIGFLYIKCVNTH